MPSLLGHRIWPLKRPSPYFSPTWGSSQIGDAEHTGGSRLASGPHRVATSCLALGLGAHRVQGPPQGVDIMGQDKEASEQDTVTLLSQTGKGQVHLEACHPYTTCHI